jgi:DNA (cytosine-5)-methyltransferase 1
MAGFEHLELIDNDAHACETLRLNRPAWEVKHLSIHDYSLAGRQDIDLLAGGLPCPPFSRAGKQLGPDDERDLFPSMLRLVRECSPKAVMIENVKGLLSPVFEGYRQQINEAFYEMGYIPAWKLFNASQFGVSQSRFRVICVALKREYFPFFSWPAAQPGPAPAVGELLRDLMSENGWEGAEGWADNALSIAPTIVGGSKKHGGPDLGPTQAKKSWLSMGVDGNGIANAAPLPGFVGNPKLTVRMVARIQGFPDDWHFTGGKTASYRQVGNAFPPQVAAAVAACIYKCFESVEAVKSLIHST